MFVLQDEENGYICSITGETPMKDDILCMALDRQGLLRYKVVEIVSPTTHEIDITDTMTKVRVKKVG